MFTQMLPWFITAAMIGLTIGLLIGLWLGSTMTRKHYTHILGSRAYTNNGTQPQPVPRRGGIPHDGYY